MGELIAWEEKYSIGVTKIDEQHKKLVGFLNDYYNSLALGMSAGIIDSILENLIEYTTYHFKDEEEFMSLLSYDASSHLAQHKYFVNKVMELYNKRSAGENISFELFDFMKEWILNHILVSDKKMGLSVKE